MRLASARETTVKDQEIRNMITENRDKDPCKPKSLLLLPPSHFIRHAHISKFKL
uniref:Uncharacterized protein n=1 Tax=Arundo donax TaxID=35708 RepID=A0A0A9HFK3_ARUDO